MEAVVKEVNGYVDNSHWKHVPVKLVTVDTDILTYVWSMQRNRDRATNEFTEYKARLNVHGGKQNFGENYAPVVTCFEIRHLVICAILLN